LPQLLETEAGNSGDQISDPWINAVMTVQKSAGIRCGLRSAGQFTDQFWNLPSASENIALRARISYIHVVKSLSNIRPAPFAAVLPGFLLGN